MTDGVPRRYDRRNILKLAIASGVSASLAASVDGADAHDQSRLRVEDLNLKLMRQGWGSPKINQSVAGNPLRVGKATFRHGIGTHAESIFRIDLKGVAERFTAKVGVDSEAAGQAALIFEVFVDQKRVFRTPVMRSGDPALSVDVNLHHAKDLLLVVRPGVLGITWDHADWIDPVITLIPGAKKKPSAVAPYAGITEIPEISSGDPDYPEFHGPRVVGATPSRRFMFKVPFTGSGEVKITAAGLPSGLQIDPSGMITGQINEPGEHSVHLTAKNKFGHAERTLRIVAGEHKLALTPPMGWNSWNAFGMNNSAQRTMGTAAAMVNKGLAAKGFRYINIDDGWQNGRTSEGEIKTTEKFGDMKKLADYVHAKGLLFGLYSSPGPTTCGGHTGSFGHEFQDARTYARWGVDYLKYDWCSYGQEVPPHPSSEQYIKPYRLMREALDRVDHDILFSLCQYGWDHVWTWGGQPPVWGNTYRISGDISDSWASMSANGFDSDADLFPFAGPGHWNDPDMLVVGYGHFEDGPLHWTKLTPHEQLTHITLWCMLAAPLLLGCDLEKLNKFTIDLMTNTEVLAIDQDEIGVQARRVLRQGSNEVWARPLFDGTFAVALFNRGIIGPQTVAIPSWDVLSETARPGMQHLHGNQPVRDLWKRRNLGVMNKFSATIAPRSAVLIKVGKPAV